MLMKNKPSMNEKKNSKGCSCQGQGQDHDQVHCHCGKPIVIGLVLLAVGAMLQSGYTFADVFMLLGGIMIVKGILLIALGKNK